MGDFDQISDLDLAALVSSKICHDAIGPMTAIGFGLDVLDEDEDEEQRDSAIAMIQKGIGTITAKLQFSRLAFGAAGSSGFEIDMQEIEKISRDYVKSEGRHTMEWSSTLDYLPKNYAKLLLNLVVISMGTVPRGGTLVVTIEGEKQHPVLTIKASGPKARVTDALVELVNGTPSEEVDARSIQPYLAGRIARSVGATLTIEMQGEDVLLKVKG